MISQRLLRNRNILLNNKCFGILDEKDFDQDQNVKQKNNRWPFSDPSKVQKVMRTKVPASIKVCDLLAFHD